MIRRFVAHSLLIASVTMAPKLHAQNNVPATYDVSTVKPSTKADDGMMLDWRNAQLKANNVTVSWILTVAFDIRRDQLSGQPDWAKEQHFDISAKLLDADPATVDKMSEDQHRALLLALLVERFGLKYHAETKEMATYDLLPAKKGLKLTPAADSGDKTQRVYAMCSGCFAWGHNSVTGHDIPLATLTRMLSSQLERTVNDRTGYSGKIDIQLKWAPDLGTKPATEEDAALPPLPQALEEQLGLHLAASRGPVKLYVIEHLDKPADN